MVSKERLSVLIFFSRFVNLLTVTSKALKLHVLHFVKVMKINKNVYLSVRVFFQNLFEPTLKYQLFKAFLHSNCISRVSCVVDRALRHE